jgi:hypothetical protein
MSRDKYFRAHRNKNSVLRNALFLQPLAQAADSDAGRLSDRVITILETSLNNRPNVAHQRRHELAAALHGYAKRKHCTTAIVRIGRREVLRDKCSKSREDLSGGKVCGEAINDTKSGLK